MVYIGAFFPIGVSFGILLSVMVLFVHMFGFGGICGSETQHSSMIILKMKQKRQYKKDKEVV